MKSRSGGIVRAYGAPRFQFQQSLRMLPAVATLPKVSGTARLRLLECNGSPLSDTKTMRFANRARSMPTHGGLLLSAFLSAGASQATMAQDTRALQVGYHQATDVFNLLDNLPDWLPGYTASAYREYWQAHIGLDEADRAALAAYAAFRQRTSPAARAPTPDPAAPPDLFAPILTREVDGLARSFLEAGDFQAGATAAIAAQAPRDRAMLRAYYARFGPRALRLVGTHSAFDTQRRALASQLSLPGVPGLMRDIRTFHGVGKAPSFVARFVWWPDAARTQAKVRGRFILLQGPADGAGSDTPMDWAPVVLHEYAHYVSAGQPMPQRQRLSAVFLRGCPAAASLPNPLNAFEEPLAIYWGQVRFEHDVRGRVLPAGQEWYFQPMADRIAKAIAAAFPATGPAPSRDSPALMASATTACLQQSQVHAGEERKALLPPVEATRRTAGGESGTQGAESTGGSLLRVLDTAVTMPIPSSTIVPTPIHCGASPARCAP